MNKITNYFTTKFNNWKRNYIKLFLDENPTFLDEYNWQKDFELRKKNKELIEKAKIEMNDFLKSKPEDFIDKLAKNNLAVPVELGTESPPINVLIPEEDHIACTCCCGEPTWVCRYKKNELGM